MDLSGSLLSQWKSEEADKNKERPVNRIRRLLKRLLREDSIAEGIRPSDYESFVKNDLRMWTNIAVFKICELLKEEMKCDIVTYWRYEERNKFLVAKINNSKKGRKSKYAGSNNKNSEPQPAFDIHAFQTIRTPISHGFASKCAVQKKAVVVDDARKDPTHNKDLDKKKYYETVSVVCIPVIESLSEKSDNLRCLGVLQFINKNNPFYTVPKNHNPAYELSHDPKRDKFIPFNVDDLSNARVFAAEILPIVENLDRVEYVETMTKLEQETKLAWGSPQKQKMSSKTTISSLKVEVLKVKNLPTVKRRKEWDKAEVYPYYILLRHGDYGRSEMFTTGDVFNRELSMLSDENFIFEDIDLKSPLHAEIRTRMGGKTITVAKWKMAMFVLINQAEGTMKAWFKFNPCDCSEEDCVEPPLVLMNLQVSTVEKAVAKKAPDVGKLVNKHAQKVIDKLDEEANYDLKVDMRTASMSSFLGKVKSMEGPYPLPPPPSSMNRIPANTPLLEVSHATYAHAKVSIVRQAETFEKEGLVEHALSCYETAMQLDWRQKEGLRLQTKIKHLRHLLKEKRRDQHGRLMNKKNNQAPGIVSYSTEMMRRKQHLPYPKRLFPHYQKGIADSLKSLERSLDSHGKERKSKEGGIYRREMDVPKQMQTRHSYAEYGQSLLDGSATPLECNQYNILARMMQAMGVHDFKGLKLLMESQE